MPRREGKKKAILSRLIKYECEYIRQMKEGEEESFAHIANQYYEVLGYESMHLGIDIGYGWTKDSGTTYVIRSTDLFYVLDEVAKTLSDEIDLDFSKYEGMVVGLPFNLQFTVKRKKTS